MKILYLPFKIIAGIVGAKLGQRVFKQLWGAIDDDDPPSPKTVDAKVSKIVAAAALKAVALAGVVAVVDRVTARAFHYLTGYWPGKGEAPEDSGEQPESSDRG